MKLSKKDLAMWVLYAGLTVTMIGGASWPSPRWLIVLVGIAILVAGVFVKKQADQAAPSAGEGHGEQGGVKGTVAAARVLLPELVAQVKRLAETLAEHELNLVANEIDTLQTHKVGAISDAQEDFVRQHGFASYATMMAPLATAERLLYRAWSAASDGHRTETRNALHDAIPYLEEADRALKAIGA